MASKLASPKSTGGGGFVFEDKACTWFLAHMFSDEPPLGAALGRIEKISFQTRPDGWFLDDLLLTLAAKDGEHRCALSVKSNVQFSNSGAPSDFVRAAWEQFLHEGSTCFDETKDYMGLVTAPLPTDTRSALAFVIGSARNGDSKTLPGRYAKAGWANEAKRTLFYSFSCPTDLATSHDVTNADIGRLLSRLQFHHFDFEQAVSESEKDGVERCRRALRSGDAQEAEQLWEHLLKVSAERRPTAGSISRLSLLDDVRHRFRLANRPNHREDWDHLRALTAASTEYLSDSIGAKVRLPRDEDLEKLKAEVNADQEETRGIVLLGPSGSGKTAITKRYVEQLLANDVNCLWFEARSFERADYAAFEGDLAITHTLRELLPLVPDARVPLVLDGLDRLYDEGAFALVASLLNGVDLGRQGSPWRPVVTCQTQEWPRLRESLLRAGIPATGWREMECKPISIEELKPVWDSFPSTARLQYHENLRPLLVNLKILDLIATRITVGRDVQTGNWVGETNVAMWYWESVIASGADGPPRARFVSVLAERQADMRRPAVPMHDLEVSNLGPLNGLIRDRVCRRTPEDQVLFEHDLFGDWARLRVLLSHADSNLVDVVRSRIDFPLWHRAIRLYGAYLLEHARDVDEWRSLIGELASERDGGAGDLLLESTVFAANPRVLLEQTKADLLKDEGRLLRRLLGRFLAFATLPDPRYSAIAREEGRDLASVEAQNRCPNWPYWPPVLRFLHEHRDDCVAAAPFQIGRIAEMWLNFAPEGAPLRQEAADLGLMLGWRAIETERSYSRHGRDHRRLCYRAALAGVRERPDEVVAFALAACKRSQATADDSEAAEEGDLPPRFLRSDPRIDPNEPVPEPWPDGPRSRVDEDFRHVVLESAALRPLMCTRAAAAVEIILAVLLKPRRRLEWTNDHWYERTQMGLESAPRWHPPLYIDGPFLPFLIADFDSGLDVITRLVGFTTERWRDYTQIDSQQYERERRSQRVAEEPLGRMAREWRRPPGAVQIQLEGGERELPGDDRVYGWPAGLGNPPCAVEAALMALEQYLYMALDQGRPIDEKVRVVLERASSVAFLKVLCDVGRRKRSLFEGPLRPVLAVPEVYYWDIQEIVQGRSHLMIGAFMRGEWFVRMAQQFHNLKHRAIDLRHVTVGLLLYRPAMHEFFAETRGRWEEQADQQVGPFKDFINRLIIGIDARNYRIQEHPEYGQVIVNVGAMELDAQQAEERRESDEQAAVLFMPLRCRRILDSGTALSEQELKAFWTKLQQIATRVSERAIASTGNREHGWESEGRPPNEWPKRRRMGFGGLVLRGLRALCNPLGVHPRAAREQVPSEVGEKHTVAPGGEDSGVTALAAGAAVLVVMHEEWVADDAERAHWCRDQLRSVVLNPPRGDKFDSLESVGAITWDCFAAEAVPVLWARDPSDRDLRHLIARLVLAPHYVAVEILFRRCAHHRLALGADFGRLRRLLFEVAQMRNRIDFVGGVTGHGEVLSGDQIRRFRKDVELWSTERVGGFVDGKLPETCDASWRERDVPKRFKAVDEKRKEWHRMYYLDLRLVRAAHAWMPTPDRALSAEERREWIAFWKEAMHLVLERAMEARTEDRHPYEDERWVLGGAAAAVQYMEPDEHPHELWQPLLDLPAEAHQWVEDFLQSFHRHGLRQEPTPPRFGSTRRAIIENVLGADEHPAPEFKWRYYDDVWPAIIGVDTFTRDLWEERHRGVAQESSPQFERWVRHVQGYGRHLAAFARWLESPAARVVRLRALIWMEQALLGGAADRVHEREAAIDPVASLLSAIWRQQESSLRKHQAAFKAFRCLLQWLADEQNELALSLTGQIGGL